MAISLCRSVAQLPQSNSSHSMKLSAHHRYPSACVRLCTIIRSLTPLAAGGYAGCPAVALERLFIQPIVAGEASGVKQDIAQDINQDVMSGMYGGTRSDHVRGRKARYARRASGGSRAGNIEDDGTSGGTRQRSDPTPDARRVADWHGALAAQPAGDAVRRRVYPALVAGPHARSGDGREHLHPYRAAGLHPAHHRPPLQSQVDDQL